MENPVECILTTGPFSVKQLQTKLNLPKKTIKYYIYTSKHITDVDPLKYGSLKKKINVYQFNPKINKLNYVQFKKYLKLRKKKEILTENVVEDKTENVVEDKIENVVDEDDDYEII